MPDDPSTFSDPVKDAVAMLTTGFQVGDGDLDGQVGADVMRTLLDRIDRDGLDWRDALLAALVTAAHERTLRRFLERPRRREQP